jgi:hypothetical protein
MDESSNCMLLRKEPTQPSSGDAMVLSLKESSQLTFMDGVKEIGVALLAVGKQSR